MNKPAASGDIAVETALSLARRAREARRLVRRRAALSAAAAVLPIPGLDIAVDLAAFANMLNQINRSFALSPGQIERLHTDERIAMLSALSQVGAYCRSGRCCSAFFLGSSTLGRCSHRRMSACSGAGACIADGTIII